MCYKLREVVQQTLSLAYSVDTAAVAKVPLLDYLGYRENTEASWTAQVPALPLALPSMSAA